jgi:hypothetical protein
MSLKQIIEQCIHQLANAGHEYDADDVLECLYKNHGDDVNDYSARLARSELRQRIISILKQRAPHDPDTKFEQLSLAGFEKVPRTIPFFDGTKVRYIEVLFARRQHFAAAMIQQDRNISFCAANRTLMQQMHDFVAQYGDDVTFSDALNRNSKAA